MTPKLYTTSTFENTSKVLLNFVETIDAEAIVQADIAAIDFSVWEYATEDDAQEGEGGTQVGEAAELTIADCVYDEPQFGNGWPANQLSGWNLKALIPAAYFPKGNYWYRVEITLEPVSGEPFYIVWIVKTLPVRSHEDE